MPVLSASIEELSPRGQRVQKLLKPLTKQNNGPAWRRISAYGDIIIATFTGSQPTSVYRDWRFATIAQNFRGMYFERWMRIDEGNREFWYLDRAYLTLYQITDKRFGVEKEFLSLHCDPNEPDGLHAMYKRGPHLHVSAAEEPIPHAHIALNIGYIESVLSSTETLSEAIEWSVIMISEQILVKCI
jgi:hypothetical protein